MPASCRAEGVNPARASVAAKVRRDVTANAHQLALAESANLAEVDWYAIADNWLKRFGDYAPRSA